MALMLAFTAGMLSTLNPCVLPMVPLALTGAMTDDRRAPLVLSGGLAAAFTLVGVGATALGASIGLGNGLVRQAAAALLLLSGLALAHAPSRALFARATSPLASAATRAAGRLAARGVAGQFSLGFLLGGIWSPCVGPTLGSAVAMAARGENLAGAALVMLVFGLGMASVFLTVAYLGRGWTARLAAAGAGARVVFGWGLVVSAALVLTGGDKVLETWVTGVMPGWLLQLTTRF